MVYGALYTVCISRKLCQTSSAALRHGWAGAIQDCGGAWLALLAPTRSAKGDGPKTPERLGFRPTGTSLLSCR